ncbi:MAG: hypothetical protein ACOWWR_09010 [Eubacteriales bacterium]
MKHKKKYIRRILVGVVIIALIGSILFVMNAFMGNPISAFFAKKSIIRYVDENYSDLDLKTEKVYFDFKNGSYFARTKSDSSIDTHFNIYYQNGKVVRDDYEGNVLGLFNTMERFSDQYTDIAKNIVSKDIGYEDNNTMVMYNKNEYENAATLLELDMKFEKTLPLDAEVYIQVDLKENTIEQVARVLLDAHEAFKENNCNFSAYNLFSATDDGDIISVSGVTPDIIENGQLLKLLENAHKQNGADIDGISVFYKEKNKED